MDFLRNMYARLTAILVITVSLGLTFLVGCKTETPTREADGRTIDRRDLLLDDSGDMVSESWEAHFVRGAKVGHRRTRVFQTAENGEPLRRMETFDRLEMKRFGDVARQELVCVSLEDAAGQVLQLAYEVTNGNSASRGEGYVDDGVLKFEHSSGDNVDAQKFRWTDDNGGLFAIERTLSRQPMLPGETRTVEAFLPLLDRVVQFELIVQPARGCRGGRRNQAPAESRIDG